MSAVKHISKITPTTVQPKRDVIKKGSNIISQLGWIIIAGACCGVNRMRVLKCTKMILWPSYLYTVSLIVIFCLHLYLFENNLHYGSYIVFKCTCEVEAIILMCASILLSKNKITTMFHNINTFDEKLNIIKDISITTPITTAILGISASIVYIIVEFIFIRNYLFLDSELMSIATFYISLFAHNIEQIFYNTLLRTIMLRLIVIKAHVTKILNIDDVDMNKNKESKVEGLAKNVQLDVTSLHNAYVLLHKCSQQLNSVMGLPMIAIIFSAGLSTIMLSKTIVSILQTEDTDNANMRAVLIFSSIRSAKYSAQILFPCYFSSTSASLAYSIRTMLHDALNNVKLDKVERRKIKAFIQMTRENQFSYALWGVISLNMSLPLGYLSLCTTYLVIVIQFSKFID